MKTKTIALTATLSAIALIGCTNDVQMPGQNEMDKPVNPHRVSLNQALSYADAMFQNESSASTRSDNRRVKSVDYKIATPTRSSESIDTAFYLVNYENGGFALLGADDRLDPVYAISESGSLAWSDTTTNKGLAVYFDMLDNYVTSGITIPGGGGGTVAPINPPSVIYLYEACSPRLEGKVQMWNQGNPYNKYESYSLNGPVIHRVSSVGCNALSIGMIMSYYKQPSMLSGYTMEWSKVKSEGYSNGLGYLLQRLNKSDCLDATYEGSSGTSADISNWVRTFQKFGYKVNGGIVSFNSSDMIKSLGRTYKYHDNNEEYFSDIIYGQPLLVEGARSTNINDAHTWVIDGYRIYDVTKAQTVTTPGQVLPTLYETYFHCVWGWEGKNNGYYKWTNVEKFEGNPDEYDPVDSGNSGLNLLYNIGLVYLSGLSY